MKIAIDGSAAIVGGSATYMYNLLPTLAQLDQENEYIIICTQDKTKWIVKLPQNFQYVRIPLRWNKAGKRIWWMQTKLPKLLKEYHIDILYSPNDQTAFFAPCPVVLAIRNLVPYARMDFAKGLKKCLQIFLQKQLSRLSAWKANKVIFVSNYSKEVTSKQLGIPDRKQITIHHGLGRQFDVKVSVDSCFQKYQPYILSVSTIYRHKNYIPLIQAFAKLLKEYGLSYNLLIAGRPEHTHYFAQIKQVITEEDIGLHVHLLGEIEYPKIPALYAGARLFVFPSYLETFGQPLIEAMASGVPVVSSNASVMPEICADAALYFDPFDPDELTQVMYKILTDNPLWYTMRTRGLNRAKEFSWIKTAKKMLDVFNDVFHSAVSQNKG